MHHLLSFLFFLAVPPQDQPSSPNARPVLPQPTRHVVPSPTSRPASPPPSKKTTPVASPKGPSIGLPAVPQKGPSIGSPVGGLKKSKPEAFLPASMLRRDPQVKVLSDGWTAVTRDHSLSAHFEHTVAVTADGPWILTARDVPVAARR